MSTYISRTARRRSASQSSMFTILQSKARKDDPGLVARSSKSTSRAVRSSCFSRLKMQRVVPWYIDCCTAIILRPLLPGKTAPMHTANLPHQPGPTHLLIILARCHGPAVPASHSHRLVPLVHGVLVGVAHMVRDLGALAPAPSSRGPPHTVLMIALGGAVCWWVGLRLAQAIPDRGTLGTAVR